MEGVGFVEGVCGVDGVYGERLGGVEVVGID